MKLTKIFGFLIAAVAVSVIFLVYYLFSSIITTGLLQALFIIFFLAVTVFLGGLFYKKRLYNRHIIYAIIFIGILLRIVYFLYTDPTDHTYVFRFKNYQKHGKEKETSAANGCFCVYYPPVIFASSHQKFYSI